MKKITLLSSFPPIKWVSAYTMGLLQELDKYCEVNFIGFKNIYPEFLYSGGTKDNSLSRPKLNNTTLRNKINRYNPISWMIAWFNVKGDVLHVQWRSRILAPIYITILLITKYIKKIPVIITIHNVLPHEKSVLKNLFNNTVYKFWDKFIVHSNDNKKQLEKVIGLKKHIEIIPHGIIYPNTIDINKKEAKQIYNINKQDKVLLFFGNIRDYKWLDILLESFAILINNDSDYKLIIAWSNREPWDKYQKIINKRQLGKYIIRLDWFIAEDKLWAVFGASDLLILPYKHFDAQSWVIALNFSFDLPLIVSDLWWLTEAINDKDLIFKVWNYEELAQKIDYIFKNDLLQKKINYIKERKKIFEWKSIVEKTLNLY